MVVSGNIRNMVTVQLIIWSRGMLSTSVRLHQHRRKMLHEKKRCTPFQGIHIIPVFPTPPPTPPMSSDALLNCRPEVLVAETQQDHSKCTWQARAQKNATALQNTRLPGWRCWLISISHVAYNPPLGGAALKDHFAVVIDFPWISLQHKVISILPICYAAKKNLWFGLRKTRYRILFFLPWDCTKFKRKSIVVLVVGGGDGGCCCCCCTWPIQLSQVVTEKFGRIREVHQLENGAFQKSSSMASAPNNS